METDDGPSGEGIGSGVRRWDALVVALAAFLVYLTAIGNGFVYDDHDLVERNPLVTEGWSRAAEHFTTDYWETTRHPSPYYRPVATLSLFADARVWGMRPAGFHLQNVLWHAACSVLVLALFAALRPRDRLGALAAGLIFAVHPVHTQSVAWIAGRTDLIAACWLLVTLVGYAGYRRRGGAGRLLLVGAAFALALFSKEVAATGVVLLLVLEIALRVRDPHPRGRPLPAFVIVLALLAAMFVVRRMVLGYFLNVPGAGDPTAWWTEADGIGARFLTVGTILAFYVRRLVWPFGLSLEDGLVLQRSLDLTSALGYLMTAGMAVASVLTIRRWPLVGFGLALLVLTLGPVSNVLPLYQPAQEHFLYLPSVGFALVVGCVIGRLGRSGAIVIGLVVLVLGAATALRNRAWANDLHIWNDAAAKMPASTRAQVGLATVYYTQGMHDSAEVHVRLALELDPDHFHATLLAGNLAAERRDHVAARDLYRRAHESNPTNFTCRYNYGRSRLLTGDAAGAVETLMPALARRADDPDLLVVLSQALHDVGREEKGVELLRRRLTRPPRPIALWTRLFQWELERGDDRGALAALGELRAATPDDPVLAYNAACLHARVGDPDSAFRALGQAIDLGYANRHRLATDPDLDPLRADPRFAPLVARVPETP